MNMEDENGLELSLGLGCGGSSAKSKSKNCSPSDAKAEGSNRRIKMEDDFENFLHPFTQKQDLGTGSQNSVKPEANFFNDLSRANADVGASASFKNSRLWVSSGNKSFDIGEETNPEVGSKCKKSSDEVNTQKKHDRDAGHMDLHDKKTSHISVTSDDSTAENEDVADSELEGSTSRLDSLHDGGSKPFMGVGGRSDVPKEVRGFSNSSIVDLQGQTKLSGSSEAELKHGNLNDGIPFPVQPINMPYPFSRKQSDSVAESNNSGYPSTGMVQVIHNSHGEQQKVVQPVNSANFPVMFGYSPIQLPTVDKNNAWGSVSHLQQFHPSYPSKSPPNSDKHNDGLKIPQVPTQYDARTLEQAKADGRQQITEEGSSSQTEDDGKGSCLNPKAKDMPERPTAEGLSLDFSGIKPGMAAVVNFGGCGSFPNLPWVSTTAPGPNGRTISGVTYRFSANQIRIVCACHGSHMSPDEFVRHAIEENADPRSGNCLATFPTTNPAAPAQS